jgi:uridine kinase/quercetin dioxygenase-like cupin family protein
MNASGTQKNNLRTPTPGNSHSELPITDSSSACVEEFARLVAEKRSGNCDTKASFVAIDGPSGSGKNTLIKLFQSRIGGFNLSVLDTNVFMKARFERSDHERNPLFRNWYRLDVFKANLLKFCDSEREVVIDQAYRHDLSGTTSHSVTIPPGRLRLLMGRYALHPEIQSIFREHSIGTMKVVIDAPQPLRIHRVRQRADVQRHRTQEAQEKLIRGTVDPDWLRYFPQVFLTADWYVVNYSDTYSVYRKPQDCIDRNHVWGAYAMLHLENRRILRLIEIGVKGATSTHRHENLDETYLHAFGGPLGVALGTGASETRHILLPGESITVPHGVFHSAWAVNDTPPVYYETVFPADGSRIDNDDILRLRQARPMSASLRYFEARTATPLFP